MSRKRTLFVGLDAACWEYYQPLLDKNLLPALQSLLDTGSRGIAHSTMPAWTPTAWGSIITGKNPGKHGIYDMFWRRPGTYEFDATGADVRQGTPFWTRLNQAGISTGLVNIPFTYPPDPVNGFVVTGFGAPPNKTDFAYPPEAAAWITENFGEYEPWLRFNKLRKTRPRKKIKADLKHQAAQVDMAIALAEKYQVDVLAINLMSPDHANHLLPSMAAIERTLIATDAELRRLLDAFAPDNVMLFSDHGSRRVKGDFLLHEWFVERGYIARSPRPRAEQPGVLNSILISYLKGRRKLPKRWRRVARRFLALLFYLLPGPFKERFWARIGRVMPFARRNYEYALGMDAARSQCFFGSSRSGLIYVNEVGRYPQGMVSAAGKPALLAKLARELAEITDPETGQPLISAVHLAPEIYTGPAVRYAPDLTLDFYDTPWNTLHTLYRGAYSEKLQHRYFVNNKSDFGHHSRDGLFVFAGADFVPGDGGLLRMADLPATLLHLYHVPLPEDWDGAALTGVLTPEIGQRPILRQPGDPSETDSAQSNYSATENDELIERLADLGYL